MKDGNTTNLQASGETERKKILAFKRQPFFWRINKQDLEKIEQGVFIIQVYFKTKLIMKTVINKCSCGR
jgi:hypothetical protein